MQKELRQARQLETVFSAMREGVLLVGLDRKIQRINRAACEMLGITTAAEGREIDGVAINEALREYIIGCLETRDTSQLELQLDENFTVQVYSRELEKENQEDGLIVVLNDISQLKQLENIRKEFVANVSHELKTPVTSIQGFVETLLDGAMHDPEDSRRFLDIIHRQTRRLNYIFNDLLILAGLEKNAGDREIHMEECDLQVLCESVRQVCLLKAEKKGIGIKIELAREKVKANSSLLEQALANLVDNAVKYSSAGSEIKIHSDFESSRGVIRVSVSDSGRGIEPRHLPRLFERFYRVDQSRSRSEEGGTGLGLAIVKHIALLHQGQVEVKSELGKGSLFSILLPAEPGASD